MTALPGQVRPPGALQRGTSTGFAVATARFGHKKERTVDKQVRQFLKQVANTVVKLELIDYFHGHPFAMDNASGLAGWLNRTQDDLEDALEGLTAEGLLAREGRGEAAVYSYIAGNPHVRVVRQVVEAYRLTREAVSEELRLLEAGRDRLRREYEALLFTERGKTETILNSFDEAVVVLDRQGTVLLANGCLLKNFGLKDLPKTVAGMALREVVSRETADVCSQALADLGSTGGRVVDYSAGERYYRVQGFPVSGPDGKVIEDENGQPFATVAVFRDVTKDREIERMREDFISMLTHDLKNPLGIILGTSTLLLDNKIGPVNEKQNRLLGNIVKSCSTMERLIQDFLTLSKLEAGELKMSLARLDIGNMIKGILQMFSPRIKEKQLSLTYQTDYDNVQVLADPIQLERVIFNLVDNALKYNREGGRIEVNCGEDERPGMVRVDVRDTGCGIAEADLPYVFEKFRRASANSQVKGSGLGLAIARQLIDSMGGGIWVASTQGEGSCFSFRLPKASPG
ncbi:MAG: PAS domain S-box protein [Candidatus Glassbacteria bacterium]|nr:PAS domain S-box protein [Candidatus Glassbacteria bacterium]